MKLSEEFCKALVCESKKILEEINTDYELVDAIDFLKEKIPIIRKYNKAELEKFLEPYEKESALFCKISLFGTMEYGRLEVAHTRTLGWLIEEESNHGFGRTLLDELLRLIEVEEVEEGDQIKIETEKILKADNKNFGRGDIHISIKREKVVTEVLIEAKVDDELKPEQYEKYVEYLEKSKASEKHLVILVKDEKQKEYEFVTGKIITYSQIMNSFLGVEQQIKEAEGYWFFKYYIACILRDILELSGVSKVIDEENIPYGIVRYLERK